MPWRDLLALSVLNGLLVGATQSEKITVFLQFIIICSQHIILLFSRKEYGSKREGDREVGRYWYENNNGNSCRVTNAIKPSWLHPTHHSVVLKDHVYSKIFRSSVRHDLKLCSR